MGFFRDLFDVPLKSVRQCEKEGKAIRMSTEREKESFHDPIKVSVVKLRSAPSFP